MKLGPFELLEPLAEGGMGVVWRAVHTKERVPVAIKLMHADTERARSAFRDEVQAMAGLHHPGIVMVFDHGRVPEQGPAKAVPGSSYVAMEYASFGSLKGRSVAMPWSQIRSTLLSLLDALAHAHARGVIHRDIKPGNVLLAGPDDVRPGIKLADFGLARALDRTDDLQSVTGTPLYMAPEQLLARWRDFGPWTDLYAMGILAWELTTGRAPHYGLALPSMINAHIHGRLPPYQPRVRVPQRFQRWLMRMLQVEPSRRYQRAADAAWELAQLETPEDNGAQAPAMAAVLSNPTMTLDDTLLLISTGDMPTIEEPIAPPTHTTPDPAAVVTPPLPTSWKRPLPPKPPVQLLGVGLSLFGLRTIPLIGRGRERDAIWQALRLTWTNKRPRLICLKGASGNGKTRLVKWVSERAHEVGGANVLQALHSPDPTPQDGIGPMVARWLRCVGLDRSSTSTRIDHLYPKALTATREALLALLKPPADHEEGVRLATAEERYVVAFEPIATAAETRPVILWLDDVQWGADALAFANFVMSRGRSLPILILMTAQSEALAERPDEAAALSDLLEDDASQCISIAPLTPTKTRQLVGMLLGFDGALAERLADRTNGNPLFAIQLVDDWISRGVLVPGPHGFELEEGVDVQLPDSLHEVWADRLQRLVASRPGTRRSLEIAAALGQAVSLPEWRRVCAAGASMIDDGLLDAMVEARLAVPSPEGFSFAHGMLRESIARLAREEGRWAAANQACFDGLLDNAPVPHARLGRHLFAAGNWQLASDHIQLAMGSNHSESLDYRSERRLIELFESVLRRLNLPDQDPRWAELWLARCDYQLSRRQSDEAHREAQRTLNASRRYRWTHVRPRAELAIAAVTKSRGHVAAARSQYQRAVRSIEELGNSTLLGKALEALAHTHIMAGELDDATGPLHRATELASNGGHTRSLAFCRRLDGDIARLRGRYEDARACFVDASQIATSAGLRANASSALHGVAEMERLLGNLDAAESIYLDVIEQDQARGEYGEIPRLNLALCQIARGHYADARERLEDLVERWTLAHKPGYTAVAHVSLVPALAGLADWAAYDHHLAKAEQMCADTGMIDIDVALAAERAGTTALEAGHSDRARNAWDLALMNWEQLGDTDRADSLLARLQAL